MHFTKLSYYETVIVWKERIIRMKIDFKEKKGFICDMDGVLYHGNKLLPGAADFIHWLQENEKEYLFLTNNSGMTPKELQQKLERLGVHVPEVLFVW